MLSPNDAGTPSTDRKTDKKGNPPFKYQKHDSTSPSGGLNLVVCVLSVVCVTASVYNGWRESVLENRLRILESRFSLMESRERPLDGVDVVLERFKRSSVDDDEAALRSIRNAPECVCPAGRTFNVFYDLIDNKRGITYNLNNRNRFVLGWSNNRKHILVQ